MFRSLSFTASALAIAAIVVTPTPARAQWGYGGWGGWGGGSTVAGSAARGMGVYAAGAGMYNEQTAAARSMNVDTNMRLNEYIYESQEVSTRRYHETLAARRKLVNASADETYKRLRDNPDAVDIRSGDALNVVLDQLNSPQVYVRTAKLASQQIPSQLIKSIPFKYAIQAITISLDELSQRGVPDALRDNPAFEEERKAVRAIFAQAKKESDSQGQVSDETLRRARVAITTLKTKVDNTLPQGAPGRRDSDNFLKALLGLTKMLATPDVARFLKELDTVQTASVGELLGFMNSFNLRFGPADTPIQQNAYSQLYPLLTALRDQVGPQNPTAFGEGPNPKNATDFFSNVPYEHLQAAQGTPTGTPPPVPPTPAAPIR